MTPLLLTVRFLTELCALAAFAYGGAEAGIVLAVALPLVAVVLWARFAAPKAAGRLPDPARLVFEIVFFGAAAAALAIAGQGVLAVLLAVVAIGAALLTRALRTG